jgi:hypothetical protein
VERVAHDVLCENRPTPDVGLDARVGIEGAKVL